VTIYLFIYMKREIFCTYKGFSGEQLYREIILFVMETTSFNP